MWQLPQVLLLAVCQLQLFKRKGGQLPVVEQVALTQVEH
jgi:hypothetical protein